MEKAKKILHYCFGMAPDFGKKPWGLSNYVCLKSAIEKIKPDNVNFYYEYEPTGPWWEVTKPLITPVKITAPTEIMGNKVDHPAHRADVVRLQKIFELGGIYLDSDVFVHRDFDDLLANSVLLGAEGRGRAFGTANAVIVAQKQAPFISKWLSSYKTFRGSAGKYWNEHSVRLPLALAQRYPKEITILDYRAFFWPLWTLEHLEWIFNSTRACVFPETYATHLWDGKSFRYTANLTPGDVRAHDTNFHYWARPYLAHLPDDFGLVGSPVVWHTRLPSVSERIRNMGLNYARRAKAMVSPKGRISND